MTDRDESKDVGVVWDGCGDTTPGTPSENFPNEVEPWEEVDGCTYNGTDTGWTRYVPHAQLLEAERKVAALEHMIERAGERLRFARVSLDQALLELNR
jgi:hypothetical protein